MPRLCDYSKRRLHGDGMQSKIQNPKSKIPERVLIIGPSNIGDGILASHAIAAIARRFPQAHMTLVVGERAKTLFLGDPRIHTLVDASRFQSVLGRLTLARMLWRHHPHVVVDLRHTLYPLLLKPWAAWRFLRRPPRALVHMRDRHRWKLSCQVPELEAGSRLKAPGKDAQGSRLKAEGTSLEPRTLSLERSSHQPSAFNLEPSASLWFSEKDQAHVEGLGKRWGLDAAPRLIIIAPGARSHIKRWTPEGFARVADRLISEAGAHVIFSGESDEEPIVEEIRGLMRRASHSAVGLVTIRQLGVLMARSQLVITNDSAALHMASALNVPTVAIFGPTDAAKYGPTADQRRVIRRWLFCSPCEQSLCRFHHECMRFISPDEVVDAATALLIPDAHSQAHPHHSS